ncbi:hypothetical protein Bealeia1_01317 [Candidatus Bealeia paramacronuclearis]|uniref:Uncharacterized protein n=1 Tax=Candidatus Bealeia paramacronuclearis TaxID=1921001 RepID=A0ABZ2C3W5_9PROT
MVDMDMEMKIEMHYLYVPSNGNFLNQALPHLEDPFFLQQIKMKPLKKNI